MTTTGYERLRAAMTDLAADVVPTDVCDRALRTSRHLRWTRIGAVAVAVLVLVGLGGVITNRLYQRAPQGIPVAAGGGWSGCAGGAARVDPARSPYLPPGETVPVPDTGTLFYLADTGSSAALVSWTPGQGRPVLRLRLPAEALMNANVSPDGGWVSWVTTPGGDLHLAPLGDGGTGQAARDGEPGRVLRSGVDGRLLEPVWSGDSTRLLVRDVASDRVGTIDIASGTFTFTPLPADLTGARHAVWASDGSAIAFIAPDGSVVVAKPDGSAQHRIPAVADYLAAGRVVASLQSMSGTGVGDAVVNLFVTEPGQTPTGCRSLVSNAGLSTGDGREGLDEAQRGGQYRAFQSVFRGGQYSHVGRELANPRTIELIGDNGEFLGGADESPELHNYLLLGP